MTDDIWSKRSIANKLLDDYQKWYGQGRNTGMMIALIGLRRDILLGDEVKLNYLIAALTDRNEKALMQKLSENNG
jgi:hypothetical protein